MFFLVVSNIIFYICANKMIKQLKTTIMKNTIEFTTTKEIWFPSQSEGDVTTLISSEQRMIEFIESFGTFYNEAPIFEIEKEDKFSINYKITNKIFVADQKEYNTRKAFLMNKYYN